MDKKIRHERILACRYYNGESEAPEGVHGLFWGYEKGWANGMHDKWETEKEDIKRYGLLDWLYNNDGTNSDFKCLLFNRYCHWTYGFEPREFLRWYNEEYVNDRLTNKARRALERRPQLIKLCRFYKGETECPYENPKDEHFWRYEKIWVELMSDSYENAEQWRYDLHRHTAIEEFAKEKNLPSSLIGLLVNRDEHWLGTVFDEDFINGIKQFYLKEI